jgi:hypothetical protein
MNMKRTTKILTGLVLVGILVVPRVTQGEGIPDAATRSDLSSESCRVALAGVDGWLKANPSRDRWETYLCLADLRDALDKSRNNEQTQRKILTTTIRRLSAPAAELGLAPLARLREALISLVNDKYRLKVEQLPAHVRALPPTFRLYSVAEIEKTKKSLQAELQTLGEYLTAAGANGSGWKQYLEWDQWYGKMSKGELFETPLLITIYKKFHSGYPGLGSPPFAKSKDAFALYLRRELTADTTEAQGNIDAHCERLALHLELLAKPLPDDWDAKQAEALAWLDLCGQHPEVVADLRERMSRPNIVMQVSAEFLDGALRRNIDSHSPVHDVILGANISGTAHTVATMQSRLIPDAHRGLLELTAKGTCYSRTTADAGKVDVYSRGETPFDGTAHVIFDERGAHVDTFTFRAQSHSTTLGMSTKARPMFERLVDRVATRKIAEQAAEADRIASRHAESHLTQRFNNEAKKGLDALNRTWWDKVRQPLLAAGEFPDQMRFSTTADSLRIAAREANLFQLASPEDAPPVEGQPAVGIRIHQSGINNLFAGIWPGRNVKQQDLRTTLTQILSRISKHLGGDNLEEPWSGRLAEHQPIQVKFEDNGFQVTIRSQRFTSGTTEHGAVDMAADYKLRLDGQNLVAERQGNVRFHGPEVIVKVGEQLNAAPEGPKAILQYPVEKLFPKEVVLESPLPLPEAWRAIGPLELTSYQCEHGWLSLNWSKPKTATVASRK